MFSKIKPSRDEIQESLPGDTIIKNANVVMDRAFSLPGTPEQVWPWFMQLGKNRAGWYFPRSIEHFIPKKKRALWHIEPSLQDLQVGKIIDDWGGKDGYFEVDTLEPPYVLVHKSTRGKLSMSWAIILRPEYDNSTRVQIRLRLAPVKTKWIAHIGGGFIDALTIAGLAAGLSGTFIADY